MKRYLFPAVLGISMFMLWGCSSGADAKESSIMSEDVNGGAADKNAANEPTEQEAEACADSIEEILDSWQFAYGSIELSRVEKELYEEGISYEGYYNVSGERLDLILEDGTVLLFFDVSDSESEPAKYELMMKGNEFNQNGFQEHYLRCYDVIWDEYYYPDLSERLWDEDELWGFNQTDLSIARNQIFARYGRQFEDPFLNAVFSQKRWYEPTFTGAEFEAVEQEFLTGTERENLNTVIRHEEERGFRYIPTD